MSNNEFWEEEPQLYWAYRFSYEKRIEDESKKETELLRLRCWLQGRTNEVAVSTALNNAFSKKKKPYPTYESMFKDYDKIEANKEGLKKALTGVAKEEEVSEIGFNFWARI